MFEIGFWEIIVIVVVALVVVGPERLPGLAREIGRFVGKTRRFVHSVRSDFEQEMQSDELRKMLKSQDREIRQLKDMMSDTETKLREDMEETERELREDLQDSPSPSATRKGLSKDEQSALNKSKHSTRAKPAVRERRTSARGQPAAQDADTESDDSETPLYRVPVEADMDGNLQTDDPALAAEQQARTATGRHQKKPRPAASADETTTASEQNPSPRDDLPPGASS